MFIWSFSMIFDVITPLSAKTKITYSNLIELQQNKNQTIQKTEEQERKMKEIAAEKEKKLKSFAAQQKRMTEVFQKSIKGISELIVKIHRQDEIQKDVNLTVHKSLNYTRDLKTKTGVYQVRTEIKLSKINRNLVSELESQITATLRILENEVIAQQRKLQLLNLKITHLRLKLVKSDSLCYKYMGCSSCVRNKKCGWCSMTQTCMEGNKYGPKRGSCMFFDYKVIKYK